MARHISGLADERQSAAARDRAACASIQRRTPRLQHHRSRRRRTVRGRARPSYNPRIMRTSVRLLRRFAPIALILLAAVASLSMPMAAAPGDAQVTPGELVIEHPTLINLGFEWHIDGDANRNAAVEVSFRKQGETDWRKGMPLARLHGEQVFQRNVFNLVVPNMFAGSILD